MFFIVVIGLSFLLLVLPVSWLWNYYVTRKALRRFPAPSIWAAWTPLWMMYHNFRFKRYLAIHHAHKTLGPVVRIGPNHLSFSSPEAFYDIYSHLNANIIKDEYYDAISGAHRATGSTRSREEHSQKRRVVAHAFSARGVAEYEPDIVRITQQLIDQLSREMTDAKIVDIQKWIHFWSFDVIGEVMYRNSFGFLKSGSDICTAETVEGKQYLVHAIPSFLDGVRFTMLIGYLGVFASRLVRQMLYFSHGARMAANFSNMNVFRIRRRIELQPEEAGNDIFKRILSNTVKVSSKVEGMPLGEMVAETDALLNAGNDTITSALTGVVYHLAKNRDIQKRLQEQLDHLVPEGSPVCTSRMINDCRYLRACIDESLRNRPPVGIGLPRLTPPGGAKISGLQIPPHTTVSAPTWTIHHDAELFSEPYTYRPERWLDEMQGSVLRKYCLPFSTGGRACVGRNLAYLQLEIAVASIFYRYDVRLETEDFELETYEWFNHSTGNLPVKLSSRSPEMCI